MTLPIADQVRAILGPKYTVTYYEDRRVPHALSLTVEGPDMSKTIWFSKEMSPEEVVQHLFGQEKTPDTN